MIDYVDMITRIGRMRYILVAEFLCQEVFPRFGMPDTISSDNVAHFVSRVIKTVMSMLGVKQKFGCVHHPQSQGAVERANGTLKAKLAKIIADSAKEGGKQLSWVEALPLALMCMHIQTESHI